jgi:hypothetical protein
LQTVPRGNAMGRRQGTIDERVIVAVSPHMLALRQMQGMLNGFWQTSELAAGYLLSHSDTLATDSERPTFEVLGHIESEIWFPNNQGRIKRTDTIGQTLKQVKENTIHTYRTTLFSFFAAFEAYLHATVLHLRPPNVSWGEYVRSLSHSDLTRAGSPLPLRTILCADVCREIRNKMIHEKFSVPTSLGDACVAEWKRRLRRRAIDAGWGQPAANAESDYAINQVVGQAISHVAEAKDKELPIELFYMLFSFTNLDSLAFAIEEALLPANSRPGAEVTRKRAAVRRTDLVIGPVP